MTAGELSSREIASQPLISVHREVRLGHSSAKPRVRSGTQLAGRMAGWRPSRIQVFRYSAHRVNLPIVAA